MQIAPDGGAASRVAIIGGGCASIAAALELSAPANPVPFDITIYQMGWRLGGKGASGRGVAGRIEEHGLHLWLGFYENAFRLLRRCYAELDRDRATCSIATFEDAFVRDSVVSVAEHELDGSWHVWSAKFPETAAVPGDPFDHEDPFSLPHYVSRAFVLALALLDSLNGSDKETARPAASLPELWRRLESLLATGRVGGLAVVVELARVLSGILSAAPKQFVHPSVVEAVSRLQQLASAHLGTLAFAEPSLRRVWTILDLVLACLRGFYRFSLYNHPRGFDAINDYDWLEWLKLNGASDGTLESAFVRGSCYDLTFAYRDGDPERPAFAAGVALRCALRMFFTYRGAVFWKMTAGMGDIVFAPAYEVLRRRGVKFEFFHKLTDLDLAADDQGRHVSALHFEVQARTRGGAEYRPLIDVRGLPCWPAEPLYDQLENGAFPAATPHRFEHQAAGGGEQRVLRVAADFDFVLLGVSLDTIREVCGKIIEENRTWRDMVSNVTSVATQAAQVWLHRSMPELGVTGPAGNLSGFCSPFDTWADMSCLIEREDWPEASPRALAYFCSALPESQARSVLDAPEDERQTKLEELVRGNLDTFLSEEVAHIWPAAGDARRYVVPRQGTYVTANVCGSDRYVQSLPGTVRYRVSPLDRSYDNLTIAGDWTRNGIDAGCVEAAVMSGLLASHALSAYPALGDIIGYNHP